MHAGVANGRDLDVLDALGVDRVQPEEREEQVGLDAFGAAQAPLAMISAGYTPSREPLEMMIETFSMVSPIRWAPFVGAVKPAGSG